MQCPDGRPPVRPESIRPVVESFKALADEQWIRLLLRHREAKAHVTAFSQAREMSRASTSKRRSVMRRVGLVEVACRGTQAAYRVHNESVFEIR
ncbi:helix-turn-helix transcriptional regulator [Alienimonas chondri]|uniref:HTH arsR-type domain-containing protein n=1 Tax=Alienimonas chondri TaxID=2681879 RepID=A0ABX1VD79_9PLAN|nr:helix-turn-helix transcriptional regulator [Alienimonas chondri]NNJ25916.1 hypothetical protein [Alienimonas chondri]